MEPTSTFLPAVNRVLLAAEMASLRISESEIVVGDPIDVLVTLPLASTRIVTVILPSTFFG